jgi:hypothetical protein
MAWVHSAAHRNGVVLLVQFSRLLFSVQRSKQLGAIASQILRQSISNRTILQQIPAEKMNFYNYSAILC